MSRDVQTIQAEPVRSAGKACKLPKTAKSRWKSRPRRRTSAFVQNRQGLLHENIVI